jgi:ribosomal protein S18 acetylase RimI-like enzyme
MDMSRLTIREALPGDCDGIWEIFAPIVAAGETYAYDPDTSREEALHIWMEKPEATFVAVAGDAIVGTYYLKPNQPGLGAHVCNCGYMVAPVARGQGVATMMCRHSQQEAVARGYLAMQFNLVVTTNEGAVRLWETLGFAIVGRLPRAFRHRELGFVDAFVMYKWLAP